MTDTYPGKENVRLQKEVDSWVKAYNLLMHQYTTQREAFEEHVKSVGQFLTDMHATMVDPCAEGVIPVKEMCELLLKRAREDRQSINDLRDVLIQLSQGEDCWCGIAIGNPMMKDHSDACKLAKAAMEPCP